MLYNLDQVQNNLVTLLQQLSNIDVKLKTKDISTHNNKKSILIKIPRVVLLQNIFIYLTDQDIIKVSSICKSLRDAVYSPFGWKILSYTRSQIKYKYKTEIPVQQDQYGIQDNIQGLNFEVNKQSITMLQQKRKILKATLKQQYESYLSAKQKYSGVVETIKVEKKLQIKYKDKSKILQSQLQILQDKNNKYRDTLKLLDSEFRARMKKLEEQQTDIIQQRNKLQNQKQAFVTKIRQYQLEIEKTKRQSIKSQDMLKKVQSFLTTREI